MKAVIYKRYGGPDVLNIVQVSKPEMGPDDIMVKVYATTVTSGDYRARSLDIPKGFRTIARLVFGLRSPRRRILGSEFAGIVDAVGANVRCYSVGDRVFAYPGAAFGGYAEYAVINKDKAIALIPEKLSFAQAAALSFGGATALEFLVNKGNIQRGERVLINGASGGVGTASVQLAKYFGAHVTAVSSARNETLVLSLGADAVIDYKTQDFTQNGETYDIILDAIGNLSFANIEGSLAVNGRFLKVAGDLPQLLAMSFAKKRDGKRAIGGYAPERAEDLLRLADLAELGNFRAHIEREYDLIDIQEAHAHVQSGRKQGNVVINVAA